MPLKLSAFPYLPVVIQVALPIWPVLPFPERSATVVPDPSSNANAATNVADGGGGAAPVVAEATLEYGPTWLPVSRARTRYE